MVTLLSADLGKGDNMQYIERFIMGVIVGFMILLLLVAIGIFGVIYFVLKSEAVADTGDTIDGAKVITTSDDEEFADNSAGAIEVLASDVQITDEPSGYVPIHPETNPAKDNVLSRCVAKLILNDEEQFIYLTQEHFDQVTSLTTESIESFQARAFDTSFIGEGWLSSADLDQLENLANLEVLYIYGIDDIDELKPLRSLCKLEKLHLINNDLDDIPDFLGELENLSWLELTNNNLDILPDKVGELSNLKMLYVSGNNLTTIPESVWNLTELTHLLIDEEGLKNATIDKLYKPTPLWRKGVEQLRSLESLYISNNTLTVSVIH